MWKIAIAQKLRTAQQSTERCSTKLTLCYAPSFPSNFSSTGQCTSHAVLPYRSVLRLASAVQNSRRNWLKPNFEKKERREKRNAEDETKLESKAWRDLQRASLVLSPFVSQSRRLPFVAAQSSSQGVPPHKKLGGGRIGFWSTIPSLKRS